METAREKRNAMDPNQLSDQHLHFIEKQNNCALCGSQLKITVETYLEDYNLREEAFCEKCGIKTRIRNHKMQ